MNGREKSGENEMWSSERQVNPALGKQRVCVGSVELTCTVLLCESGTTLSRVSAAKSL